MKLTSLKDVVLPDIDVQKGYLQREAHAVSLPPLGGKIMVHCLWDMKESF